MCSGKSGTFGILFGLSKWLVEGRVCYVVVYATGPYVYFVYDRMQQGSVRLYYYVGGFMAPKDGLLEFFMLRSSSYAPHMHRCISVFVSLSPFGFLSAHF